MGSTTSRVYRGLGACSPWRSDTRYLQASPGTPAPTAPGAILEGWPDRGTAQPSTAGAGRAGTFTSLAATKPKPRPHRKGRSPVGSACGYSGSWATGDQNRRHPTSPHTTAIHPTRGPTPPSRACWCTNPDGAVNHLTQCFGCSALGHTEVIDQDSPCPTADNLPANRGTPEPSTPDRSRSPFAS